MADHYPDKRAPLRSEARAYAENITYAHIRRLIALNWNPARAIGLGILGIAETETLPGELWAPCEGGTSLLTVTVAEDDAVADIVAFDPTQPGRWYLRKGAAWALGIDAIDDARGTFEPSEKTLHLHATPFEWLKAGMRGTCVINWTPEARATILDVPAIHVRDQKYAARLRLVLSKPPRLPFITYKGYTARAAALSARS